MGVAGLLLAGCGASDPIAAEEVSAAVTKTASQRSSRVEVSGKDGTDTIAIHGVADYERRLADFSFDVKSMENPSYSDAKLRVIGSTMYMDSVMFGIGVGTPEAKKLKPWLEIKRYDEDPTLDTLIFPFPFFDPGRILATFKQVSGGVESLGEESVRGVPANKYRLTLDLERLIETAPADKRTGLRQELEERKTTTQSVDVWIDDAGLARRIGFILDGDPVNVDFFNFGIGVDVEAPPADQVEHYETMLQGSMEESSSSGNGYEEPQVETVEEEK
jgi:hypothetical protein